ncbi:MAG: trigger factor [Lachnospiraceae bacterium]|nr:trigger factor [Lachnospiraceae bacterium]
MKKFKKISKILILTMSLTLLGGCGHKSNKSILNDMIDKYSAYCTLGEYKGIEYDETKTVVDDELVNSRVQDLLSNYSTTEYVTTGTAQIGDTVNIDFVGSIDGVEFEGGNTNGAGYDLTLGSGTFIDGFEDQIIGHSIGDEFNVYTTFPEDYSPNPDLAGKEAVFAVTLNSIVQTVTPEYTDEFVAANTDYSTIAEYEQSIRDSLSETYADSDSTANKTAVMEAALANAVINEYPTQEIEKFVDEQVESVEEQASQYGYDLGTYLAAYSFTSEEMYRDYIGGIFKDFIEEKIVVCAIAKAENITVSDDEIKDYKQKIMDSYGITDEDAFAEIYTNEEVIYYTLADKVAEFLVENAVPTVATGTDAE